MFCCHAAVHVHRIRVAGVNKAGYLDDDEVIRPLDAEEVWIIHKIVLRMLANDHEAVAIWRLQDLDKPAVNNVDHSGPILGTFPLSQIDTCERHAPAPRKHVSKVLFAKLHWVSAQF